MEFLNYIDTKIVGNRKEIKLDIVTFTAGFLQQIIQSEKFSSYEKHLQQQLKFISFILHLVHRCGEFTVVYKNLDSIFEDLRSGVTGWEDDSYFGKWEEEMLTKTEYSDRENNVNYDSDNYETSGYDGMNESDSDSAMEPKVEVKEEVDDCSDEDDIEEKSFCKISISKKEDPPFEAVLDEKEPQVKMFKDDEENEIISKSIIKDGINQKGKSKTGAKKLRKAKEAKMCEECGIAFKDLQQHILTKHNITWQTCTIEGCKFRTPLDYELRRHMDRKHSDKNVTTCQFCGTITRNLRLHMYKYKCDEPGMGPENVKKREAEEREKEPKSKGKRGSLNSHLPTPCPDCGVVFTKRKSMLQHRKYKHLGIKHPCDVCDYQAPTSAALSRHKQTKHEGLKFYCDQCSFSSTQHYQLKIHIQTTHQGLKYSCDQCNFQANTPQVLKNHVLTKHEGLRYQCDQCEYNTTHPSTLIKHVKFRHEGAEFPCEICEYRATTASSLKTHIQTIHEGLKFDCPHCPYQAAQAGRLREHIIAKHEDHHYACNQCSFGTKSKKSYVQHLKNTHDLKYNDIK